MQYEHSVTAARGESEERMTEREENAVSGGKDVYGILRRGIINFSILPGQILSENTLAAKMDVGRAAVRDAIAQLEAEHCVEVLPQRGTQVSLISMELVRQALFFRLTLERDVLEALCRQRLTEEQKAELAESLRYQRELYAARRSEELLEEDAHMHRLFYRYCGREGAWDALRTINCDMLRVRYLQIQTYSYTTTMVDVRSWENHLTEHRLILDSLRLGDAEALRFTLRQHLGSIEQDGEHLRRIYPQYFAKESPA